MADREISDKLSSGEIVQMKIGGVDSDHLVVVASQLKAVADEVIVNADDIAVLGVKQGLQEGRLDTLETLALYEYSKVNGVSTTDNTYAPLNALSVISAEAGIYEFKFTLVYTYSTTNKSAYFRMSNDGGTTWVEVRREAKDSTDVMTGDFSYPHQHNGGDIDLIIEYKTESTGDTLNVMGSNIVIERKK